MFPTILTSTQQSNPTKYSPQKTFFTSDFFELHTNNEQQNEMDDFDISKQYLRSELSDKSYILKHYYDDCLEKVLKIREKLECWYWFDNCKIFVLEQRRRERLSPENMTKVFLKMFYVVEKKIRSLEQKSLVKIVNFVKDNDMKTYQPPITKGIKKLNQWLDTCELKYVYNHPILSQQLLEYGFGEIKKVVMHRMNRGRIERIVDLLEKMYVSTLLQVFNQKMLSYQNLGQKLDIFKGTLSLMINPIKRGFWLKIKQEFIYLNNTNTNLSRTKSSKSIKNKVMDLNYEKTSHQQDQSNIYIASLQQRIRKNQQICLEANLYSRKEEYLMQQNQNHEQGKEQIQIMKEDRQKVYNQQIGKNLVLENGEKKIINGHFKQQQQIQDQKQNDLVPAVSTISQNLEDKAEEQNIKNQITEDYFANIVKQIKKSTLKTQNQNQTSKLSQTPTKNELKFSRDLKRKSFNNMISPQNKTTNKMKFKSVPSGVTPKKNSQKEKQKKQQQEKIQKQLSTKIQMALEAIETNLANTPIKNTQQCQENKQEQIKFKLKPYSNKAINKMFQKLKQKSNSPKISQEIILQYQISKTQQQQSTKNSQKTTNPKKSSPDQQPGISQPDFSHFYSFPNISTQHLRRQTSRVLQQSKKSQLPYDSKIKIFKTNNLNSNSSNNDRSQSLLGQESNFSKVSSGKQQSSLISKTLRPKIMSEVTFNTPTKNHPSKIYFNNINTLKNQQKNYQVKLPGNISSNINVNNDQRLQRPKILSQAPNSSPTSMQFRNQYKFPINSLKSTNISKDTFLMNVGMKSGQKKNVNFNYIQGNNKNLQSKNLQIVDEYHNCSYSYQDQKNIIMNKKENSQKLVKNQKEEKRQMPGNNKELPRTGSTGTLLAFKTKRPVVNMKSPRQKGLNHVQSTKTIKSNKHIYSNINSPQSPGIKITQAKSPSSKQETKKQKVSILGKKSSQQHKQIQRHQKVPNSYSSSQFQQHNYLKMQNQQQYGLASLASSGHQSLHTKSTLTNNQMKLGSGINLGSSKLTINTVNIGSPRSSQNQKEVKNNLATVSNHTNINHTNIKSPTSHNNKNK